MAAMCLYKVNEKRVCECVCAHKPSDQKKFTCDWVCVQMHCMTCAHCYECLLVVCFQPCVQ